MASTCPRGHASDEPDYCSVCGAPLSATPSLAPVAAAALVPATAAALRPALAPVTALAPRPALPRPSPSPPVTLTPGALVLGAGRAGRWPTRRLLRWVTGGLLACTALLLLVSEMALSRERSALQTLGRDTAPSIIAAQQIRADLADLDASAADSLLGVGTPRDVALAQVARRRSSLVSSLVDASHNITYGDAERAPIITLVDGMGRHLELWAQARQWHENGDPARARLAQRAATELLRGTLLPAADALDRANRGHLDEVYAAQQAAEGASRGYVLLTGGALLLALAGAQVLLAARTRRILSLPLLGATLLAAATLAHVSSTLAASHESLRAAREDAFESIHLLITARALAFDASGDQSRELLDPDRGDDYRREFAARMARLFSGRPPAGSTGGVAVGLLDRELANVTYPGEREAATDAVTALTACAAADVSVRRRSDAGDRTGATALRLGQGPDGARGAFARLDESLGRALAINQQAFGRLIDTGSERLHTATPIVPLLTLLTGALVALGMRPRLREYR